MYGMDNVSARRPQVPPAAAAVAAAAVMSVVLDDDDILREILFSLGLPTSLLRAALVCKRWYRVASDLAFLRRLRDRHPPPILGIYLSTIGRPRPRFFTIRPHPELATIVSLAGSFFDAFPLTSAFLHDSRGGRLLVTIPDDDYRYQDHTYLLCSPLSTTGNAVVVPPPPPWPRVHGTISVLVTCTSLCLPDGGDGRSYVCVSMRFSKQQTTVYLYELQDMSWVARASATAQLPVSQDIPNSRLNMLFDDSKFYILVTGNKILVCDFQSSSISGKDVPNEVANSDYHSIMLSRGDGTGIYLIHVDESLLRVWRRGNAGNWFLVCSICLRQVCANLGMADWSSSLDGHSLGVKILAVGDTAKFVFLWVFGTIIFLDIIGKQAEKVYEMMPDDMGLLNVHPLVLTWPPVFRQMKEGCCQQD